MNTEIGDLNTTVYGALTDGFRWVFAKLTNKSIQVSKMINPFLSDGNGFAICSQDIYILLDFLLAMINWDSSKRSFKDGIDNLNQSIKKNKTKIMAILENQATRLEEAKEAGMIVGEVKVRKVKLPELEPVR